MRIMRYILSFVMVICCCSLWAQSVQQVQVMEYNGREKKTPLAGVSLSVQNAGSSMSDAQGALTLQFRSQKAGDQVQVRRIDLAGYEVFNQDAVDAWTISTQRTFQLVLCKSERFKALCDQYNAAASASYERQLKRDRQKLDDLKREGKLKEEEYVKQVAALENQYNEQLDKLENYVDRFARIDLSEISEQEQQIIALVEQGDIDEAIRQYEAMNLLGKYQQQSSEILEVRNSQQQLEILRGEKVEARDSLISVLKEQIRLYEQLGDVHKADSLRSIINQ